MIHLGSFSGRETATGHPYSQAAVRSPGASSGRSMGLPCPSGGVRLAFVLCRRAYQRRVWKSMLVAIGVLVLSLCISCFPVYKPRPASTFSLPLHNNDHINLVAEPQTKSWGFIEFFRSFWDNFMVEWNRVCHRDKCLNFEWTIILQEDPKIVYLYLQPGSRRYDGRTLVEKSSLELPSSQIRSASRLATRKIVEALATLAPSEQ